MTYEEKYNELIKRIKKLHESGNALTKAQMEIICPELAESEDERIRKWLIEMVEEIRKANPTNAEHNGDCSEAIAYLEKQKEQKPVKLNDDTEVGLDRALQIVKAAKGNLCGYQSDDGIYECDHAIQTLECILKNGIEQKPAEDSVIIPQFHIGDYIKPKAYNEEHLIKDINKNGYVLDIDVIIPFKDEDVWELAKQKPAEWSEEDREMIQSIITNGCIDDKQEHWLRLLPERILQPKQEWSEHDKKMLSAAIMYVEMAMDNPGVVRDALLLDWLKRLPASIHPQPHWKPSKQEKSALRIAIYILTEERNFPIAAEHLQAILDAFEGKESRKDWKPSEEQMQALKQAQKYYQSGKIKLTGNTLESLYNDLKKLM